MIEKHRTKNVQWYKKVCQSQINQTKEQKIFLDVPNWFNIPKCYWNSYEQK